MPPRRTKVTLSVRLDGDLVARLKSFVKDNAGRPLYATMTGVCGAAIEAHLAKLERQLANEDAPRLPSRNSIRH